MKYKDLESFNNINKLVNEDTELIIKFGVKGKSFTVKINDVISEQFIECLDEHGSFTVKYYKTKDYCKTHICENGFFCESIKNLL